ncbi:hypothetical protein RUND412_008019 [Rhizina undulata]
MSSLKPIIHQHHTAFPHHHHHPSPSSSPSSASSSRTFMSSVTSTSDYASSISSHNVHVLPARPIPGTRFAHVSTGRPQGGSPRGGPSKSDDGYTRIERGNVVVHNTGGQVATGIPRDLGPEFENGPEHTGECRRRSRWSDNQGLCFCP